MACKQLWSMRRTENPRMLVRFQNTPLVRMRSGLHLDEATVRKNGFEVGSNPAKLGAILINVSVQSLSHTKQAGMQIGLHQI